MSWDQWHEKDDLVFQQLDGPDQTASEQQRLISTRKAVALVDSPDHREIDRVIHRNTERL
jgi:hypothetical protein